MKDYKVRLLSWLEGRVLEIGAGDGVNLKYFQPDKIEWIGIEPDKKCNKYIRDKAEKFGFENISIINSTAERLPIESNSVDFVVGTLVLCSVDDPLRVLSEVNRVLKDDGVYIFIEHIAAKDGSRLRKLQEIYRWSKEKLKEGCRPNQDTLKFLKMGDFEEIAYKLFKVKNHLLSPRIAGFAFK